MKNQNYSRACEDAHIFDPDIISQNIIQDKVSFITFSDYNLFELTGDYDTNYILKDVDGNLYHLECKIGFDNKYYAYRIVELKRVDYLR